MKKNFFLLSALFFFITELFCQTKFYTINPPHFKDIGIYGQREELVWQMKERYLKDGSRDHISEVLFSSINYRPYIRAKLHSKHFPLYLQYLPLIESSYKPTAVSPSGATGLWQFMENSVHPFLKITEYYDERLDPWKETDAAIAKLNDNYKMFNDWALALAAYNMGAGALKRVLKENPDKDFWGLANENLLPKQTREYVPKLIAIADIIENADYYGLIDIGIADKAITGITPPKYKYAKIKGSVKLSTIEECTGIDYATLKFLNPSLLQDKTPKNESYKLRLPPETDIKEFSRLLKERKPLVEKNRELLYHLPMIKTVIFDLDGTLLNTLEDLTDSCNRTMKNFNFPEHTLEEVRNFVGNGLGKLIERAIPGGISNPEYENVLDYMKADYSKNCLVKTKPYDGVLELIEKLNQKGIHTAIVSNKPDPEVKELAKVFFTGIKPEFALGESEQIKRKPNPDAVLHIMKELNSSEKETLYVGDSDVDFQTAANAGVKCISVTWGFRTKEFLINIGAENFASTPDEVMYFVK